MEFLTFIPYIIIAIFVLLLMVTIHEFGHYTAGKALGFKITEFAVGFGPVLAIPKFWDKAAMQRIADRKARYRKINEQNANNPTPQGSQANLLDDVKEVNKDYLFRLQFQNKSKELISVRIFPLGGFCAFFGEDQDEDNKDSFNNHKPWKRLIVQAAGSVFNLVSAVIFSIIFIAVIGYASPKVVEMYSSSSNYGIMQAGDQIIAVNGKQINVVDSFSKLTSNYKLNDNVEFLIIRDGQEITKTVVVTKYSYVTTDGETKEATGIGMSMQYEMLKHNALETVGYAFPFTVDMSLTILRMFGQMITGGVGLNELGGPITTITTIGGLAQSNFSNLFILLPLLAANLGLFNLFPIPALDGSRMVFTTIEWIRKKPINRNIEAWIHFVGFILLFGFVILTDLLKFF